MSVSIRRFALLVALASVFFAPVRAPAGEAEWQAHMRTGMAAYQRGDYRGASASFAEPLAMVRCRRFVTIKKPKATSRILEAVHETASDPHRLGFSDKRKMRTFDALCLDPTPKYDSGRIRALRDHLQLTQSVLAALLNASFSTVRKWVIGEKHSGGPSLKLLSLLDRKGLEAVL